MQSLRRGSYKVIYNKKTIKAQKELFFLCFLFFILAKRIYLLNNNFTFAFFMYRFAYNNYTIQTNTNGLIWHNELSADRIQKALNKFRVDVFQNDLYRLMDTDYKDLNLIIKAFGMKIPNKMFIRRGDIKEMKSSMEKAK